MLSECAAESTLTAKYPGPAPWTSMAWAGKVPDPPKNPDKGLAVMTFGDYSIQAGYAAIGSCTESARRHHGRSADTMW